MAVCARRPESPGFFTPCKQCPCGAEVKAELAVKQDAVHADAPPNAGTPT